MADRFVQRCRPLLGTFVEIMVPPGRDPAVRAAFAAVEHVHTCMSFHSEESDLASLRRAPAGEAVAVDRETVAVLRVAADLHVGSGGLFDVSIGNELTQGGFLPCPPNIDPMRMIGTAADIEIVDATHVRCHKPLLIDLGGIAKGHAVDRGAETLIEAGVEHAVVNAGGDLRVVGERPQPVYLREADGAIGHVLKLADAALASSSILQNRRPQKRPHIGWHRKAILASDAVSIVASKCIIADAMTKIALADPELAVSMLETLDGEIIDRLSSRAA